MAIKDIIDFSTFTDPGTAFDLFSNSIRRSFTFDSYGGKTKFQAVVLTNPIPVSPDDLKYFISNQSGSSEKISQFVYRARIVGENSPHQFIPDPCDSQYAGNQEEAYKIIEMHTLFVSNEEESNGASLPRINSLVEVELEKNVFGYNLGHGKHIGIVTNQDRLSKPTLSCDSIQSILENGEILNLNFSEEKYTIRNFTFESIPQPEAADEALGLHEQIGAAGINEYTLENRKKIVDLVHIPIYEKLTGKKFEDFSKSEFGDSEYYYKNLAKEAWSSWFLNRVYINSPSLKQIEKHTGPKNVRGAGCCYPNPLAAKNRRELFNATNPEEFLGREMLLIFSLEEIRSKPSELDLVYGDASVVGQGEQKLWEDTRNQFKNGEGQRAHMNVYVGDKSKESDKNFIGGNLGNTTRYVDDRQNTGGFMKYVKITGFNP